MIKFRKIWISIAIIFILTLPRPALTATISSKDKKLQTDETTQSSPELLAKSLVPPSLGANLEKIFADKSDCPIKPTTGGKRQLRLLTRDEFNRSVNDIFHLARDYQTGIPLEHKILGFRNNSEYAFVSSDHAAAYDKAAKDIASDIVQWKWSDLIDCKISDGLSCAESFIRRYGSQVWRRPLSELELQSLMQLYRVGSDIDSSYGMQTMLRGLLSSPNFLYRKEIGQAGALDPYEIASGLSYFFWGSTPDQSLSQAAQSGQLLDPNILLEQAQRLLLDSKAKEGSKSLADAWLNSNAVLSVNKDSQRYPGFTSQLRLLLAKETEDFFDYALRYKKSGFEELFTANYSLGDQALALFYGGESYRDDDRQKLRFPGQTRQGLLGHASILASLAYAEETGPIQRGKFVREQLLCEVLAPPPPNLDIKVPSPQPGLSTRERFALHTSVQPCKGCHVKIDGVGFGMEDFDAVGLYRELDNGKVVDASGTIYGIDGQNLAFNGAGAMSALLAQSVRAKKCFVVQVFRLAHGRLEDSGDICALRQLSSTFVNEPMSLAELLVSIIVDPSFTQRTR